MQHKRLSLYSLLRLGRRLLLRYKRLSRRSKAACWTGVFVVLAVAAPPIVNRDLNGSARRAQLYFLVPPQDISIGQDFPVELRVRTNGQAINAQGFVMRFDPRALTVASMTTEKSFCTFYLENNYDNAKGEIRVFCGIPKPGFVGDALAVRAVMRAKHPGTVRLTLDESAQLLANDGKGSNIIKDIPELSLNIRQF